MELERVIEDKIVENPEAWDAEIAHEIKLATTRDRQ